MRVIATLISRGFDILVRRWRDARLDEEIDDHLTRLAAEFEAQGLTPAEARLAARRAFGGVDQVKAVYRARRGWPALDACLQDWRFAWRLLWRDARYSATVAAVLGLGIGVSHLFFTLTYAYTVRGLPMPQVGEVFDVSTLDFQGASRGVSYADFVDLRELQRGFEDVAAFASAPVAVAEVQRAPERADATYTTPAAFALSRVSAELGRVLEDQDDQPGRPVVAVIAARMWHERFGGDPAVLGRVVEVNEHPATIVGVVSDASGFPSAAALWLPLTQMPGVITAARSARTLRVFGRLREGVTATAARGEVESVGERLAEAHPETNRNLRWRVVPINERFLSSRAGWVPFMLAGIIVIAVAAVNVANLMLVRAGQRVREFAIRTSLGATRGRLARQLLIESLMLAALGAAVGLAVSRAGVWAYRRGIPEHVLPYWVRYEMDAAVWGGLAAILAVPLAIGAVVLVIVGTRCDPNMVLRDGGRSETGRPLGPAFATLLLAAQLALALVLLTQVGLTTIENSFNNAPTDAVVTDAGVLTASFSLNAPRYADQPTRAAVLASAIRALEAVPGATGAALTTHLPLGGAMERQLRIAGRELNGESLPMVSVVAVSPKYFATLRLPVLGGRSLTDADSRPQSLGVVINERLAGQYFPDGGALGARLSLQPEPDSTRNWATIVGIVPDVRQHTTAEIRPIAYVPLETDAPVTAALLVRAPAAGASAVREAFRQLDPSLPLYQLQTLEAARWNTQWVGRMSSHLATVVTVATTVLAIAGLFAVMSNRILHRTREIGIRVVLGAGPHHIVRLVGASVRNALGLGLVLGQLGVLAWTRAFSPERASSLALTGRLAIVVFVALTLMVMLASAVPARWAVRLQPREALRREC